jgi:branched-subunit amino acid transport protein
VSLGDIALLIGMALAVYLPKALPLVAVSERLTLRLRHWLQYVAPAVLGALIAPSFLAPEGHLALPGWQQVGYLLAFVVAVVTRRMLPSLVAGLAAIAATAVLSHVVQA